MARRTLIFVPLLAAGLLAGCSDNGKSATPGKTTAGPTTAAFTCPVSRRQVEAVYLRLLFADSVDAGTSCTFARFGDESGSLSLDVGSGGAAAYGVAVAKVTAGKAVAGVGDEAIYSEGATTLVARSGDRVLILTNHSLAGFDGAKDAASQSAARRTASIALAKMALAS